MFLIAYLYFTQTSTFYNFNGFFCLPIGTDPQLMVFMEMKFKLCNTNSQIISFGSFRNSEGII